MNANLLYWPVLAQLAIPIWVLMLNGKRKAADRKSGNLNPDAPIDNKAWSLPVILTSNALANQFQLPIVFYVLCLILVNLDAVTVVVLSLSWTFVVSRWVHAYVHVTTNTIAMRFSFFLLSSLMLLALFAVTIWSLALSQ